MSISSNEIQALKKALLDCNKELVVEGVGIFKPSYKAANLSSDGRTIVQPRYGWSFCLGNPAYLSASVNLFNPSITLAEKLKTASGKGESFEISGLGLFYQQNGCYELMPEPGHLIGANQHYGLMPLSIQKVRTSLQSEIQANKGAKKSLSNLSLKIAASFLGILFLSLVAFQYFSTDGEFFERQEAGLNIFSSEPQKLYQAPLIRERSTDINEILELISRVADSVMYERAKANDSLASAVDSSQLRQPFFEIENDASNSNSAPEELEKEQPKELEKKNEKPEARSFIKENKESNAPTQIRLNPTTQVNKPVEANKKEAIASQENPLLSKAERNTKNNLANNGLSSISVDKKNKSNEIEQEVKPVFVVVGSFQSLENAERLKADLTKKGYQVSDKQSILVGRLHRVVIVNSIDSSDANSFLVKAQKEISPSAWVLKD